MPDKLTSSVLTVNECDSPFTGFEIVEKGKKIRRCNSVHLPHESKFRSLDGFDFESIDLRSLAFEYSPGRLHCDGEGPQGVNEGKERYKAI